MNRARKAYLDKQKLINCGRCPYHRGENRCGRFCPARIKKLGKTKRGGKRDITSL